MTDALGAEFLAKFKANKYHLFLPRDQFLILSLLQPSTRGQLRYFHYLFLMLSISGFDTVKFFLTVVAQTLVEYLLIMADR